MKNNWKITGFIATLIIVLAFPLYIWKAINIDGFRQDDIQLKQTEFVGSNTCVECHKSEYDLWLKSDHYFAMDTASESSILGDFNNAELEREGQVHKLYQKDGEYFAFTDGADGQMQEFKVAYTFGAWPLQQYLVPFPDGKYQTLGLTWDTIKKQWYYMADLVYAGQDIDHTNWLHWSNLGQNWNGMCADCHSTNLKKGFDANSKTFNTTWSEINVACEACHGPSSEHLKWANLPALSRPQNTNTGLTVQTSNITNYRYVDLCARCHTRRGTFDDYNHEWQDLLDQIIPALPSEPTYFADGQILEEDYVFGSFAQSKMYMNDVKCNDCHNVHSGKLVLDGNQLCLQCHRGDMYDNYNHHFHKQKGEQGEAILSEYGDIVEVGDGASCINCHMPGRYYMGVDYRRDHSFRIPRPDLSEKLGTPNSCTHCHADKTNNWAAGYLEDWYGKNQRTNYGAALALANLDEQNSFQELSEIFQNDLYPPITRALALTHLASNFPVESRAIVIQSLTNIESIIRYSALQYFILSSPEDILVVTPLLNDPVKAVRFESAVRLSNIPKDQIPKNSLPSFEKAIDEYKMAMEYSGDFAASRHNLGNYYENIGETGLAIDQFIEALKIDNEFFPAKVNLAMAYNKIGDNEKAEIVLKDVVEKHPDQIQALYSLGLLLAEMQKYDEAIVYLKMAAVAMPENARVFYNLGQIQDFLNLSAVAETNLKKAYSLSPDTPDYFIALIEYYIKHRNFEIARKLTEEYKVKHPNDPSLDQILNYIDSQNTN